MTTGVLIVDDEDQFRELWGDSIRSAATDVEVDPLTNAALLEGMRVLEERRIAAREAATIPLREIELDATDALVVDYDLAPISAYGTLTGEAVSYLGRSYSSVGFVVLLNAVSESYFDLSLRGEQDSFADLVVGSRHIGNAGLWHQEANGFRPWNWPVIPNAVEEIRAFAAYLEPRLDMPVLTALHLENVTLSRGIRALVESPGDAATSIRDFVSTAPTGLRRKDVSADDASTARIAASRLRRWLEFDVLSSQDVLVDAPHLVGRFPSLLVGDPADAEAWNATAIVGVGRGLDVDALRPSRYPLSEFMSREAWFWRLVREDRSLPEVAEPFRPRTAPFVFCEDVSKFLPAEATRDFVADVAGDYIRRFIVDVNTELGRQYVDALDGVELRPMSRLSLT